MRFVEVDEKTKSVVVNPVTPAPHESWIRIVAVHDSPTWTGLVPVGETENGIAGSVTIQPILKVSCRSKGSPSRPALMFTSDSPPEAVDLMVTFTVAIPSEFVTADIDDNSKGNPTAKATSTPGAGSPSASTTTAVTLTEAGSMEASWHESAATALTKVGDRVSDSKTLDGDPLVKLTDAFDPDTSSPSIDALTYTVPAAALVRVTVQVPSARVVHVSSDSTPVPVAVKETSTPGTTAPKAFLAITVTSTSEPIAVVVELTVSDDWSGSGGKAAKVISFSWAHVK